MTPILRKASCFLVVCIWHSFLPAKAQDTVHITIEDAEKQFIQKNLALIAAKYDISIAEAQLMQAKLFNNPSITFTGSLYDPDQKKFFNVGSNGQYDVAVQQLIRLAGKRNKEIKLAITGVHISEAHFYDLLRTLRYSLRSNFYEIHYKQMSIAAYDAQLSALKKMDAGYSELESRNIITTKDAIRIRSLLYSLQAEISSLQNELNDVEASMQLLLSAPNSWFVADVDKDADQKILNDLNLGALIDTAFANRSDLREASYNLAYSSQNYALQKALAKPDITLGSEFDKRGSFVNNASFLSVGVDIPIFNRNQGNIKAAKTSIIRDQTVYEAQKQTVEAEVGNAYRKYLNNKKFLEAMDPRFNEKFENLLKGITENFEKKNISLTEFADFMEAYRNNILQYNQLQDQRQQALETLQFTVGKNILNP